MEVPDAAPPAAGDVYLEVQRSAAFQEVRSRYRRFVLPAAAGFLSWYFAYVVTATTAPDLMARPVAGAVNVAMLAGLGQFLTTFLLTWAYTRHARLRRDRAALELRWDTQELTRGTKGGVA
ncbi:Membrane protein OS=Streptomyces viridochromogenes OX=1938 GN=ACM01_07380 PE=4 SV=1 [Streptomyces viridochromogenes]